MTTLYIVLAIVGIIIALWLLIKYDLWEVAWAIVAAIVDSGGKGSGGNGSGDSGFGGGSSGGGGSSSDW